MCVAGPALFKPPHMLYNVQHCSPEVLRAHSGEPSTQIDARAQDMWSIGSLLLCTLTQGTWFPPRDRVGDELVEDMQALHGAWVSSCM